MDSWDMFQALQWRRLLTPERIEGAGVVLVTFWGELGRALFRRIWTYSLMCSYII